MFCLTFHFMFLTRSLLSERSVPSFNCYTDPAACSRMAADPPRIEPVLHCQLECAQGAEGSVPVQVQCSCKCFSSSSSNVSSKSSRGHSQWECLAILDPWACPALPNLWACSKPSPLWARRSGQPCLHSQ